MLAGVPCKEYYVLLFLIHGPNIALSFSTMFALHHIYCPYVTHTAWSRGTVAPGGHAIVTGRDLSCALRQFLRGVSLAWRVEVSRLGF